MSWILSLTVGGLVAYLMRVVKQKSGLHEQIGMLKERVKYAERELYKQKAVTDIAARADVDAEQLRDANG